MIPAKNEEETITCQKSDVTVLLTCYDPYHINNNKIYFYYVKSR